MIFYLSNKSTGLKVLLIFYFIATALMIYSSTYVIKQENNIWTYNLLFLMATICIGSYFYTVLNGKRKRTIVITIVVISSIYSILKNFILGMLFEFDSFGYSILSIIIVIFVLMYFQQRFQEIDEQKITDSVDFWLTCGYLIFYVGGFLIFATFYYLAHRISGDDSHEEKVLLTRLWGVHNLLLFISAFVTLVGSIWTNLRRKLD